MLKGTMENKQHHLLQHGQNVCCSMVSQQEHPWVQTHLLLSGESSVLPDQHLCKATSSLHICSKQIGKIQPFDFVHFLTTCFWGGSRLAELDAVRRKEDPVFKWFPSLQKP